MTFLTKKLVLMTFSNFTHEIHINPVSIIGFFRKIRLFHEKSKKMVKNTEKDENDLKKAKIAKKTKNSTWYIHLINQHGSFSQKI